MSEHEHEHEHGHDSLFRQRGKDGRYQASELCDACNKPTNDVLGWYTDDEVCQGSDGPGFYLCHRVACGKRRDLPLEERKELYASMRRARMGAK
jgi:hypothetical protein